jgi:hypothetical protein
MPQRATALNEFYSGRSWKAHSGEANATMVDVDNVLLLRPVSAHTGFPAPAADRPPVTHTAPPSSLVLVTIYYGDRPFDEEFLCFFEERVRPRLIETGAAPLACFQTEYAENNFPALPVREGEHVFVWFARFAGPDQLDRHLEALNQSPQWTKEAQSALSARLVAVPQQLRLAPTARSLLR